MPSDLPSDQDLLERIDGCCDALPRAAATARDHGPLRLFVRTGPGWPYYARPVGKGVTISPDDVRVIRARQRHLGVPEELEWIHDLVPTMAGAATDAGLRVRLCPLLVLDAAPPPPPDGVQVLPLDDDSPLAAARDAIAQLGFGFGAGPAEEADPQLGRGGTAERDRIAGTDCTRAVAEHSRGRRSGPMTSAVGLLPGDPELPGPLSCGRIQHAVGMAEIVGVATLPVARRRGLAGAVTAELARQATAQGMTLVFLSAQDDAVARVYTRVGFRRIGTAGLAAPG